MVQIRPKSSLPKEACGPRSAISIIYTLLSSDPAHASLHSVGIRWAAIALNRPLPLWSRFEVAEGVGPDWSVGFGPGPAGVGFLRNPTQNGILRRGTRQYDAGQQPPTGG